MTAIRFEWDARKSKINEKKHGVSFDEAKAVFFDERARLIPDPDHSEDEDRFILLGSSSSMKVLVVCHCYRGADDVIRIISARKATKTESSWYSRR
jgi:uncharacterized DUF497 family protein